MQAMPISTPVPIRTPSPGSNGDALNQLYPNYNGYVDNPIENSSAQEAVASASNPVKQALKGIDLTHIKPSDLGRLGAILFAAGQISSIMASTMIVQQVDGDEPINFMQVLQQHQSALQQAAMKYPQSSFNFGIAGYSEAKTATSKLSDFIKAITPGFGIDVMA